MASMTTLTDAEAPEPVSLQEKEAEWLWVEFEANDPENAMHWPSSRKWTVLGLLTMFTFIASIVGTSFAIGSASLEADLGCSHELAILALVTYFAGFGLAPLVLAPLSELMGRSPVYKGSAVLWLIFMVVTAVGKNIETVIIARFLSG
ncbi:major facilitator superfamily domain-containing protein, partial [Leucosporidium creatinivorum]